MIVKPFYIRHTPEITDAQVAEVFDKAVSAGAIIDEGVLGFHQCKEKYLPFDFTFFGVTEELLTFFSDHDVCFGQNCTEITLDQVDEWLDIAKQPTVAERMAALIEEHKTDIDEWARWIAVDADGECCVFSKQPRQLIDCFSTTAPPFDQCDLLLKLPKDNHLTINWRETLTELKPATEQEQDHGTIEVDPVKHATSMYNQQKMIDRDERDMSQAELDYEFDQLVAWNRERIKKRDQKLTIPSTLPAEQAMPMMLGGEFGGVTDD